MVAHDGVDCPGAAPAYDRETSRQTLVLACCDPAVGLLAARLASAAGVRLLALQRTSRPGDRASGQTTGPCGRGSSHSAGDPGGNARVVAGCHRVGFQPASRAQWEEGIAFASDRGFTSTRTAVRSETSTWIGREAGSGPQYLDVLLGRTKTGLCAWRRTIAAWPRRSRAAGPRPACACTGQRGGGARLPGRPRGTYDLCFPASLTGDPRIQALLDVARSPDYRKSLGELPGYDSSGTGEISQV